MENQNIDKFYKSLIFKLVNSIAGSKKDLGLFLLVNLVLGILYTFKIWDHIAILLIFGILLPIFYTISLYRLFKIKNIPTMHTRLFKFAKSDVGNIIFLLFDLSILICVGVLILFNILNYAFFKLLIVIIIPCFYLITLHGLINDQFDLENKIEKK